MKASLKRWVGRVPDISAVVARFPVVVALMAVFTVIIILFDNFGSHEPLGRMLAGLIVGAYLAFCITVAREAKGQSRLIPLQILIAIVVAVLAWFSKELRINLVMAIGAVLLILGNMVIWRKSRDDLHVWDFTHKIWTGAVFATVGSIIFTLGVLAIQAALKSLFGVNINELTERLILPIGLGFLAPLYWLSTAPRTDEDYQELHGNPGFVSKAVAFMGTWLLSPLTLIYALILIAYGLKIILAGSLPKGEIAQLTTPFLIAGALTWLVLEPPFIKDKALAKLFRKLWFPLSIPAAIMLAISVGVRIGEYGFTPERIALLMAVIWALGLGLWFTFGPKAKRDIRLVPGVAAVLLLLGTFGAEALSMQNQNSRAIGGLKAAGIMSMDGIIKPRADIEIIDETAARKAKGSLAYLVSKREFRKLKKIFDGAKNAPKFSKHDYANLYKRLALEDITVGQEPQTNFRYDAPKRAVNIAGFEKLYGRYHFYAGNHSIREYPTTDDGFKVTTNGNFIIITDSDEAVTKFDLHGWVKGLKVSEDKYLIDDPVITIFDENGQVIALKIESMNSWKRRVSDGEQINVNIDFYVLAKGF